MDEKAHHDLFNTFDSAAEFKVLMVAIACFPGAVQGGSLPVPVRVNKYWKHVVSVGGDLSALLAVRWKLAYLGSCGVKDSACGRCESNGTVLTFECEAVRSADVETPGCSSI